MEQSDLRLVGLLEPPVLVRDDVLRTFGDSEEKATKFAVKWAWLNRRVKMDQSVAAAHIEIQAPHFSNILNGKKHLPPHKINAFEWAVGNRAVSLTIERFRKVREEEHALVIARQIVRQRTGTYS